MADVYLTSGNDTFNHLDFADPSGSWDWFVVYGLAGDDVIELFAGRAAGGQGNDTIIGIASVNFADADAYYGDGPSGGWADLEAGYAIDGWGGRDTLINVKTLSGGGNNDIFFGSAANNRFFPNGGRDLIDGRGGYDLVAVDATLADYTLDISGDGRRVVMLKPSEPSVRIELIDVEVLEFHGNWGGTYSESYLVANLVPASARAVYMLQQDLAARWNAGQAMGSAFELTYSFRVASDGDASMPGSGFQAFSSEQQQLVRDLFDELFAQTGLSFREVADTGASYGQMRFGISQQTDTAGVSYAPNDTGSGARAGDVWMDVESMADVARGSIGYGVLLHEIGHALGLAHPGDDGTLTGSSLGDDDTSFTVMSANGLLDGVPRATFGVYDLLALQEIYGSKQVKPGNDWYSLSDADGLAQGVIFDDGGFDTIDASRLSYGVSLQLQAVEAGALELSSVGVRLDGTAAVDNLAIVPGSIIESVIGTRFDDLLIGNSAGNALAPWDGNDYVDGGDGIDTAFFYGRATQFLMSQDYGTFTISDREGIGGSNVLVSIERVAFDSDYFDVILQGRGVVADTTENDLIVGDRDDDVLYGESGNDLLAGGVGNDRLDGGAGLDAAVYGGTSSGYKLELHPDWILVRDMAGQDGIDTLTGIERLQFQDREISVESASHASYAQVPDELYHFFIVAFGAAPGVTYMNQLAEAYQYFEPLLGGKDAAVRQIVDIFTTKQQYLGLYPNIKQIDDRTRLVEDIVKASASDEAKAAAVKDIGDALEFGWTVGKVIYAVFGNLAGKPVNDQVWGGTAQQFANELSVARYYTEVLNQSTDDVQTLRDVIRPVTQNTDVSTVDSIVELIGVALLEGSNAVV